MGDSATRRPQREVTLSRPRNGQCGSRPAVNTGKADSGREASDAGTDRFRRGTGGGMREEGDSSNTEAPTVARTRQPGNREDQLGPAGWRRGS